MPVIQEFHSQQGVLPANPGEANIHPEAFGAVGEALQGLGNKVEKFGADWLETKTKAEENDAIMKTKQDVLTKMANSEDQIRAQYSSIDPQTGVVTFDPRGPGEKDSAGNVSYPNSYSKTMMKAWQDSYSQSLDSLPSERAKNEYSQYMGSVVTAKGVQAINFENQQLVKHLEDSRGVIAEKGKQNLYDHPDLTNFAMQAQAIKEYDKANEGVLLQSEKAVETHNATMRDMINNGLMRGYLDKDPQAGLALLNSKGDPAHPMADPALVKRYMDNGDVAHWNEQFQNAIQQQNHAEVRQLNNKLTDIKAAASLGKSTVGQAEVKHIIESMDSLGAFETPEDKTRAYSDAMGDVLVGKYRHDMNGMTSAQLLAVGNASDAQLHALVKDYAQKNGATIYPEFGARDAQDMRAKVQSVANQMIKQVEQEPAQAALERLPTVQKMAALTAGGMSASVKDNENYFSVSMSEQKRLGASEPLPLTPAQVQDLTTKLQGATGTQSGFILNDLQSKTGKYYPDVMRQLVRDGKLPEFYASAGYMDDPMVSGVIINDLRAKKTFDKVLQENRQGYKEKDVKTSVNSAFSEYEQALTRNDSTGQNQAVANGLKEAILYQSANLISQGAEPDTAAELATKQIIGKKYEVYNGALIPRDKSEVIKSRMSQVKSDNFVSDLANKIYAPENPALQLSRDKVGGEPTPNSFGDKYNVPTDPVKLAEYNRIKAGGLSDATMQERETKLKKFLEDDNAHAWMPEKDNSGLTLHLKKPTSASPLGYVWVPVVTKGGGKVGIDYKTGEIKVGK